MLLYFHRFSFVFVRFCLTERRLHLLLYSRFRGQIEGHGHRSADLKGHRLVKDGGVDSLKREVLKLELAGTSKEVEPLVTTAAILSRLKVSLSVCLDCGLDLALDLRSDLVLDLGHGLQLCGGLSVNVGESVNGRLGLSLSGHLGVSNRLVVSLSEGVDRHSLAHVVEADGLEEGDGEKSEFHLDYLKASRFYNYRSSDIIAPATQAIKI